MSALEKLTMRSSRGLGVKAFAFQTPTKTIGDVRKSIQS